MHNYDGKKVVTVLLLFLHCGYGIYVYVSHEKQLWIKKAFSTFPLHPRKLTKKSGEQTKVKNEAQQFGRQMKKQGTHLFHQLALKTRK